jgi:hypothetical protein|tara:strand:- start:717 stop:962 length:246 start_codon:yes stop_codon:yes gene_type:complete
MKLQNKKLDEFLTKAEQDPEIMEALRLIISGCHQASEKGISLEEVAAAGTMGWTIGNDPQVAAMVEYMFELSKMGLGPKKK